MKLNNTVTLGLVAGILHSVIWYFTAVNIGVYTEEAYLYRLMLMAGLVFVGVPIVIYLERNNNGNSLEFKAGLKTGLLYAVVFASVMAFFNYVYHQILSPDTVDYFVSEIKKKAISDGRSEEEIQKMVDWQRSNFASYRVFPPVIFSSLIASLLFAGILQKKPTKSV